MLTRRGFFGRLAGALTAVTVLPRTGLGLSADLACTSRRAWTIPATSATGTLITAAMLDAHIRDNISEIERHVHSTGADAYL